MENLSFKFQNVNVLVTGAAQGIGFEISKRFLGAGAQVILWDYSQEALDLAKKELSGFSQATFQKVDVTSRESCEEARSKLPCSLHVLINNAGITRDKSLKKMTGEDFDAVIQTNLVGLFNVTKGVLDSFDSASTRNRIINISSVVGLYGNFGQSNYAAAKAGVIGLTKTWAKELGRKGFTVNAVAPGFVLTKMTQAMPSDVLDSMASKVPVGRLGLVEDIASACLFLSSNEASYINGTVLSVDGGIVI